jgi:ketosteroid isomerase-like protein
VFIFPPLVGAFGLSLALGSILRIVADNVELVRDGFEALERGGVEELLPFIHPEFETTTPPGLAVEPDTYRGHEGLRRYFDSFYEVMDEVHFIPDEFVEVGERVVVPIRVVARGRETGIEAEQRVFQVWSLRDEQAHRVEVFATRREAMDAAARPGEAAT